MGARGRSIGIGGLIGWLLIALLSLAVAAPSALAAEGGEPSEVESLIRLKADPAGLFEVETETRLKVPRESEFARPLLQEANGETKVKDPLGSALDLFPHGTLDPPPRLRGIEAGALVADTRERQPYAAGLETSVLSDNFAEPFEIEWRDGLRVSTLEPNSSEGVRWVVTVELERVDLDRVWPQPSELVRDGHVTTMQWRFGPGQADDVALRLDPPWTVTAVANIAQDGWGYSFGLVALLLGTLFVPSLFLLLRKLSLEGETAQALRRQARWLSLAILFALLAIGAELLLSRARSGDFGYADWPRAAEIGLTLLPLLLVVACAWAVQSASRRGLSRAVMTALAGLLGLTFGLLLYLSAPPIPWEVSEASVAAFVIAALAWALLVYLLLEGALRVLVGWFGPQPPAMGGRKSAWVAIASSLLVAAIVASTAAALGDRTFEELQMTLGYALAATVSNAMFSTSSLLPLALLPGTVRLLRKTGNDEPFLVRARGPWLLVLAVYLFFVVTATGLFAGFSSPWSLLLGALTLGGLALFRIVRLERLDQLLGPLNRREPPAGKSLLLEHRQELIDRALLIERMQRLRSAEHQKQAKSDEGGGAFVAYRERLHELDDAEAFLQEGTAPEGRVPSAADGKLVQLRFLSSPPVIYPALGCGPGGSWQENGRIAFGYGAVLSLLPLSYVLYLLLRHQIGSIFSPAYGFELLSVLSLLSAEVALWLVAAYSFGCLFTWLPSGNGALKGFLLSLPVIIGIGLLQACPLYNGATDWTFRCVEVLAFLSLLGVIMDIRTVRDAGLRPRDLADLYQVRSLRFGIVNLAPLILAAIGIYQQIRSGDPQGALEQALKEARQIGSGG